MEKTEASVISMRFSSEEERFQRFRVMLQQTGGDPSAILDLLSTIVKNMDWRRIPDEHGGTQTFLGYFRTLGWSGDDLLNFVENMHHKYEKLRPETKAEMDELRRDVRRLSNPVLPKVGAPIGSHNNPSGKTKEEQRVVRPPEPNVDNINFSSKTQGGTSASYAIQRLKRDAPELAEKVIRGEMTPRAASIQAGIRVAEFSIPVNPQAAARRILKRFRGESLVELIRILANHAGFELKAKE
jgi:hypothetical protein